MATPIPPNDARITAWSATAATHGSVARVAGEGAVARGITTDSRAVRPGSAFVALRGVSHDGHAFIADAVARGASLVIVERGRPLPPGAADVVEVDDTLVAWGALARAHLRAWRRARPQGSPARVVAITGSAGKTTTKELCAAILATAGPTLKAHGNLNNRIGVPAMAFCVEPHHAFAVLEAGMSVPGEIAAIASIVEPDVAVITNASVAHAAGVGGTRAHVAHEKGALLEALAPSGCAVVNADDEAARGQLTRTRAGRASLFGRSKDADYRLVARTPLGFRGSKVVIARGRLGEAHGADVIDVTLPIVGEAAAIDLVAALAAADAATGARAAGPRVAEAMGNVARVSGRAAVCELAGGIAVLDDSYNANPSSMRAALAVLREIAEIGEGKSARRVAVLGEMKELGDLAEAEHASLGDAIADAGVALAIGCGGLVDGALARAESRGVRVIRTTSATDAAAAAVASVEPGDVVLVKASRSVGAESVVRALVAARGLASGKGAA